MAQFVRGRDARDFFSEDICSDPNSRRGYDSDVIKKAFTAHFSLAFSNQIHSGYEAMVFNPSIFSFVPFETFRTLRRLRETFFSSRLKTFLELSTPDLPSFGSYCLYKTRNKAASMPRYRTFNI